MQPLYVLTSVFNPRRFASRYRLYRQFAAWVRGQGLQLLTAEVAFGDRPFQVTEEGNPWHLQLRSSQDMWHKERSLNLAVNRLCQLVPKWEYFCYLDADVKLLRDDWAEETVHLLQHYAILQPFGELATLDPKGHPYMRGQSIARRYHEAGHYPVRAAKKATGYTGTDGWPGLGWAYRRAEFEAIGGLYDVAVASSGDMHMAGCYLGKWDLGMHPGYTDAFRRSVQDYAELCDKHVRGNVSYTPGMLVHYWHGKGKDRGHASRKQAIIECQFDPHRDLIIDAQGLHRWRGTNPRLERLIRRSMEARNEDSIDM
jgi:hypothetical protein